MTKQRLAMASGFALGLLVGALAWWYLGTGRPEPGDCPGCIEAWQEHDVALYDRHQAWHSLLHKFDANHNGRLDPDERRAHWEERRQELLKRLDTNGDGVISEEETRVAFQKLVDKSPPRFVKRFDANGDGHLDEEELKAAYEAFRERIAHLNRPIPTPTPEE